MDMNVELLQWSINYSKKKKKNSNKQFSDKQLAEELHRLVIKNLTKGKYNHLW